MAVTKKQIGFLLFTQLLIAGISLGFFVYYMIACQDCLMRENIPRDIFSILCLTYLMISNFQINILDRITRIFSILLIVGSLHAFCDMMLFFVSGEPELRTLTIFIKTLYYIDDIAVVFIFGRFVCLWSGYDPSERKLFSYAGRIVAVMGILLCLCNAKMQFIFTVDENGVLKELPRHFLPYIAPYIMMFNVYMYIITMKGNKKDKLFLMFYGVLPIFVSVVHLMSPIHHLLPSAIALSILFIYCNIFVRRSNVLVEKEKELLETELNGALMQINPHFIYNTLGTIASLCDEDAEQAETLIYSFSDYLRDNFSDVQRNPVVTFRREIEHLDRYLTIEKIRFPKIDFSYDFKVKDFEIPNMSLQPIAENAIKHGICRRPDGTGSLKIVSDEDETSYIVRVIDDGTGFDVSKLPKAEKAKRSGHVGIENVRLRLQILCQGSLQVESTPGKGTTCTVIIPKNKKRGESV